MDMRPRKTAERDRIWQPAISIDRAGINFTCWRVRRAESANFVRAEETRRIGTTADVLRRLNESSDADPLKLDNARPAVATVPAAEHCASARPQNAADAARPCWPVGGLGGLPNADGHFRVWKSL